MKIVTEKDTEKTSIIYDGGLDELKGLIDTDGEVNNDKLLDFLLSSDNITHTPETLRTVQNEARKRKLDKIDKNENK